jgi:hypothetical protein
MRPRVVVCLCLGLALAATGLLAAQDFESLLQSAVPEEGAVPLSPQQFGGRLRTGLVPIQSFVPIVGGTSYQAQTQGYLAATTLADVTFWAPLAVPVDVRVQSVCLEVFDNDDAEGITFLLVGGETGSAGNPTPAGVALAGATSGVSAVPGFATLCAAPIGSFVFPLDVRTSGNLDGNGEPSTVQYYLLVGAPATRTNFAVMFGPAVVTWRQGGLRP